MEIVRNIVGNILGVVAVLIGLLVAVTDQVAAATACLSAGVLILLIANVNHFELIKGFGFEARTKKLDEKIEEADRLLAQLKQASQLFADVSAQLISRSGFLSGPIPKNEALNLVVRIQGLLAALGVDKADVDKGLIPFHQFTLRQLATSYFNIFLAELNRHVEKVNHEMGECAAEEQARTGLPVGANNKRHVQLQEEMYALKEFIKKVNKNVSSTDPFELGGLLGQLVEEAPGWTLSDRRQFLDTVKPMIFEWEYYAKNLRLNDVSAWLAREYGH